MENQDGNIDDGHNSSFWKKNMRAVPGRPSPRKELKPYSIAATTSCSFQDFQQSVNDAWDMGDDEFCNISNLKISKKGLPSQDTVINIHKSKADIFYSGGDKKMEPGKTSVIRQGNVDNVSSAVKTTKEPQKISSQLNLQYSSLDMDKSKIEKFKILLETPCLNIEKLQKLSWPGIPFPVKADTWRLLAGYAPPCLDLRKSTLNEKRSAYWNYVKQYYYSETRDEVYQGTYRQIHIDIPRMSPTIGLLRQKVVQDTFERILFIWAVTHPESGYVQGINDLVTPFYIVFLHQLAPSGTDLDTFDMDTMAKEERDKIEADSYWCFCKFLDGIQDNYIFPQPGIQHKINRLRELIQRIDGDLHEHLQSNGVEYLQFSFRWMNNLLTRELPLRCLIRLWDTYLAELDTFACFQLFVCAAFLLHWRQELIEEKDFQGLMLMLQNLPTQNWNDTNVGILVAEAYRLKFTFADAPNHFQNKNS